MAEDQTKPITQKDWDRVWLLRYNAYWLKTRNHFKSSEAAHRDMLKFSGPRPEGEPSRPGLLLELVKVGLQIRKVSNMTKPSVLAVSAAIGAAAAAFGAAYTIAIGDGVVVASEWIAILIATIPAFLSGLFTSPSKNQ